MLAGQTEIGNDTLVLNLSNLALHCPRRAITCKWFAFICCCKAPRPATAGMMGIKAILFECLVDGWSRLRDLVELLYPSEVSLTITSRKSSRSLSIKVSVVRSSRWLYPSVQFTSEV
jgi:hypothetical protein